MVDAAPLLPKDRGGVTAENRVAVGGRNTERAHLLHAIHHAHVIGIIAPEKHPICADRRDQEFERGFRVQDGVVEEAIEIFFR